jgi:hypothetical protein
VPPDAVVAVLRQVAVVAAVRPVAALVVAQRDAAAELLAAVASRDRSMTRVSDLADDPDA